jgi:hypothetical protein
MPTLYTLSERDVQVLERVIATVKRDPGSRGGDPQGMVPLAADSSILLVKAPAGGLAAAASADCTVCRVEGTAVNPLGWPQKVYNQTAAAIAANTIFVSGRTRYGTWVVAEGASGGGAAPAFSGIRTPGSGGSGYKAQTIPNNVATALIYTPGDVQWDTDGYLATGQSTFKLTKAGYFLTGLTGYWTGSSAGTTRGTYINTSVTGVCVVGGPPAGANNLSQTQSGVFHGSVGDTVTAFAVQDSGAGLGWNTQSFWLAKVG